MTASTQTAVENIVALHEEWPQSESCKPIEDYALIGDCRTGALIARDGSIEWLCFPDFHSPSVFCSILDRKKGGCLRTTLAPTLSSKRRYVDDTNILETELAGPEGRIRIIDFMPVTNRDAATLQPERELLRIIEAVEGSPTVEVEYCPAPAYGKDRIRIRGRGRIGWTVGNAASLYLLRSDIALQPNGPDRLAGEIRLDPGQRCYLSLSYVKRDPAIVPPLGAEIDDKLEESKRWWRQWSSQCTYAGPYRDAVLRSTLALKALQFSLSGAVIAAATTSLPETIGGERNWDYRYCWLRDAAFTLRAFIDTGFYSEASAFFDWLMHTTHLTQPKLQALYDIYGRTNVRERTLKHLAGYRDSRPVRIGNAAHDQLQLDIYGSVIAAATIFIRRGNALSRSESRLLAKMGEVICRKWREPDNGIWEFRRGRQHNTWSKLMCWSGLNDLVALDRDGEISVPRQRFIRERDAIRKEIERNSYDDKKRSFVGAYDNDFIDATSLLFPQTGFLDPDDPRMQGTWRCIRESLDQDGLIRRYGDGSDSLSGKEGSFVICSFWAVGYLARAGHLDEAKARMENLLGYTNDVGLLSEEIDPQTGAMLGNFPQAFSHSGLINAAFAIAEAEAKWERA